MGDAVNVTYESKCPYCRQVFGNYLTPAHTWHEGKNGATYIFARNFAGDQLMGTLHWCSSEDDLPDPYDGLGPYAIPDDSGLIRFPHGVRVIDAEPDRSTD